MSFKRFVNAIEVLALAAAITFAILLFANEPSESGNASTGAKVYAANCASCHGADGGGGTGPKLAGRVGRVYPDIEDQVAVVTKGRDGMPSFEGDLTAAQILDVVEYTRTDLGK